MTDLSTDDDSRYCHSLIRQAQRVTLRSGADGAIRVPFEAEPGLYQFSVIADARGFNWEELYEDLHMFHNKGQRTGPWDFKLGETYPLVPSYWVRIDGRRVGLWYFERVSLSDLEAKRFRGRMAFHLDQGGRHELELIPYRAFEIRWISATLEPDPEDVLEPFTGDMHGWPDRCPAAAWADEGFWLDRRKALATTHHMYAEPLRRAFDWVLRKREPAADDIPLLIAAYHLDKRDHALDRAVELVDKMVALPHWGNPREDAYGHNGDMGAVKVLRPMAWALHALRPRLKTAQRQRLVEKLALQGNRFLDGALLSRDYWGGSVMQDHGWQSLFGFGTAALHLLGTVPEAERWIAYVVPRLRRAVDAIPRDGVIPSSSFCALYLYLNEPTFYRDTLLSLTGHDIYDDGPFHAIIDYLLRIVREPDGMMSTGTLVQPFVGGNAFLNRIARKYQDGRAACLQRMLLGAPLSRFYHPTLESASFRDAFWGFMTYDPSVSPVTQLPQTQALSWFEDSGLVHYHDREADITLSLRLAPYAGHHAFRRARGPCDRMGNVPGAGHFIVCRGSRPVLTTPDSGYRLKSFLRTCMLVDGEGQWGDIGYPMSMPSWRPRGEDIEFARWDPATGTAHIRLNLAPAYPEHMQLAHYTRDFICEEGSGIVCRDHVVCGNPHKLSWLFHVSSKDGIEHLSGLKYRLGGEAGLTIEPDAHGVDLYASTAPTDVVWSYASMSHFEPFVHLRYDTPVPVTNVVVDFIIRSESVEVFGPEQPLPNALSAP